MSAQECIFTRPLGLDDLQAMFTTVKAGVVKLFGDGCCIDTEPPFPPKAGTVSASQPKQSVDGRQEFAV